MCLCAVQARFTGDNFLRYSGEAPEVQKLQLFAWNAAQRGNDVHINALPTQGQLLHKEYNKKKDELKDTTKVSILAKYGGEEYLEKAPKELLHGQTEEYVEYSRTGQVIKGKERAKVKSKYAEDGMSAFTRKSRRQRDLSRRTRSSSCSAFWWLGRVTVVTCSVAPRRGVLHVARLNVSS